MTRFLLICLIVGSPAIARTQTLITLRESVALTAEVVTLGSVAEIRSGDAADSERLAGLMLGPAPGAGREVRFEFDTIRNRIAASGFDLSRVQFRGATVIRVTGERSTPVPPTVAAAPPTWKADAAPAAPAATAVKTHDNEQQAMHNTVAAAVRRHLLLRAPQLGAPTVAPELTPADFAKLTLSTSAGFDVSGGQPPYSGQQLFLLRFLDAHERIHEVAVACAVTTKPSILAAARPIPRGRVILDEDLTWRPAENDAESQAATDMAQLVGREAVSSLRPGQAVRVTDVKSVSLVRSGQFVTVTSHRPGISVQRMMRARADGGAGDMIAVQTLEDHRTLLARVTGSQEAEAVDSTQPQGATPNRTPAETSPVASQAMTRAIRPVAHEVAASQLEPTDPAASTMPVPSIANAPPRVFVNPAAPLSVEQR